MLAVAVSCRCKTQVAVVGGYHTVSGCVLAACVVNAALKVCIAVLTNWVLEHKCLLATFPMLIVTDIVTRHTYRRRCMTQLMLT